MKAQTQRNEKLKISPTAREIIAFLRSRGGASSVGVIGSNRSATIRHLRRLEALGVIECLSEPERFKPRPDSIGMEGVSLNCGVWGLVGNAEDKPRTCGFCFRQLSYESLPDGSVCYQGLCACADCLQLDKTAEFRARVKDAQNSSERDAENEILWEKI